jgi:molecular chaperone DnaK (HSP70)
MSRSRYIVGIDLGTTNCALAYVDTKGRERPSADVKVFEIPQLVAPGETRSRSMLPSFLYLAGEHELPAGSTRLPWRDEGSRIVGELARVQGASVPGRLVSSAKSWLCHAGVDREAEILPWGAASDVSRLSPVDASAEYIKHLREAWNYQFAATDEASRLEAQEIILTVPASFDEAARELTVEAAKRAGLDRVTLIEEPQAAFYCWIVTHKDNWQKEVKAGELILVCDIGGGTTDFSLITVVETPEGPGFRRVAVGDHLMLGGDNIDLALAHQVERKLGGIRLDARQWSALAQACRTAKEKLLADDPPDKWPILVAGRGSKLIGGSIQAELTRAEALHGVLDGFFPLSKPNEEPARGGRAGLQEFGLPFVAEPAVPRHLASFLKTRAAETPGAAADRPVRPDLILFNGGALTPTIIRNRIVDVINSWFVDESGAGTSIRVLSNDSLDLAVAIGAAYYGVARRGGGIRVGGGTARSYYIGFESHENNKPWLCVVPRDAEEGDEITIDRRDFELLMGQPVQFPLASSSVRPQDVPGDLVPADPDSIRELPPVRAIMKVGRKAKAERVPVRISARVSEIGTIELWCRSITDDRRWRLQIQLRTPTGGGSGSPKAGAALGGFEAGATQIEQSIIDQACEAIRRAFAAPTDDETGPSRLIRRLEEILDADRSEWPASALRAFWEPLRESIEARGRSPRHESRWLNLAGYCLRPGAGYPLDELRIKALWPLFHQGLQHIKDGQCRVDWWVLWRRTAAGLNRAHHEEIERRAVPLLGIVKSAAGSGSAAKKLGRPKPEPHEIAEIWRCVASLERLSASLKEKLADALIKDVQKETIPGHALWCLGRLDARTLLFGPANAVVPPQSAERRLEILLNRTYQPGRETTDAIFAFIQIARISGDRARDLDPEVLEKVIAKLRTLGADESRILPLVAYQEPQADQQAEALGEAPPIGLRLIPAESDIQQNVKA